MAQLRGTFLKGLETIFSVFEEAVKDGVYRVDDDNEFNDSAVDVTCPVRCIFGTFEEKDVALLSFSELIQPNDILGLIPFEDLADSTLKMTSSGGYITFSTEGVFTVVAFEKDPLDVLYTVLLRQN